MTSISVVLDTPLTGPKDSVHSRMRFPRRASGKVENGGGDVDVEVDGVGDDEGSADGVEVDDVDGIGGAVADSMANVVSSTRGLKAQRG